MSLITHMTLLAMVGALASAPGAKRHVSPLVITLSTVDGEDAQSSSLTFAAMFQGPPRHNGAEVLTEQQSENDAIDRGSRSRAPSAGEVRHLDSEKSHSSALAQWQPLAAMRRGDATGAHEYDATALTQQEMDHVVDRFIQFDTGRLRGEAAARARQDFHRLGPEAIPALVRGLNRAAAIRASCPIAVISQRLTMLLNKTNEPELLRYALENIGNGVDTSDPHFHSIQSLANRWKKQFSQGQLVRFQQARSARGGNPIRWNAPEAILNPAQQMPAGDRDRRYTFGPNN